MGARKDPVVMALTLGPDSSRREVVDALDRIADELADVNARQAALWDARRAAYVAGRQIGDTLTLVELAAAARVSQPQVARALSGT